MVSWLARISTSADEINLYSICDDQVVNLWKIAGCLLDIWLKLLKSKLCSVPVTTLFSLGLFFNLVKKSLKKFYLDFSRSMPCARRRIKRSRIEFLFHFWKRPKRFLICNGRNLVLFSLFSYLCTIGYGLFFQYLFLLFYFLFCFQKQ